MTIQWSGLTLVRKKRVLMISPRYIPAIGGVETHLRELGEKLTKSGFSVTVLTCAHKFDLPRQELMDQINILRIPYGWNRNPFLTYLWMTANRRTFTGYSFVHIHDTVPLLFWYFPLLFINVTTPVFATFHGYERDPVPWWFILLRKIANRLVRGSLCIGHFIREVYGINCDKIVTSAVKPVHLTEQSRDGAVFVGRIEQDTGIVEYVNALDILQREHGHSISLTVCGSGSIKQEVLTQAELLSVNIEYMGHVSKPREIMNTKQICFAAGYLSILEAMSLGLPVIGIARSPLKAAYLKGVLKDGGPISIQTTPEGVAREIARIINDPQLAARISKRGKQFASKMSWDRMTRAYLDLWTGVSRSSKV